MTDDDLNTLDALCEALEVDSINDLFEYRRAAQRGGE